MFRDLFRSQGYTNNNSSLDWDWNRIDSGGSGSGSDGRDRAAVPADHGGYADPAGGDYRGASRGGRR